VARERGPEVYREIGRRGGEKMAKDWGSEFSGKSAGRAAKVVETNQLELKLYLAKSEIESINLFFPYLFVPSNKQNVEITWLFIFVYEESTCPLL
jgi:hypothetical protein